MTEIDSWVEAQEFQINLDAQGKIVDYIDNEMRRPNTPEERIRQKMVQILHREFGYPRENIGLERSINIGREVKRTDNLYGAVKVIIGYLSHVKNLLFSLLHGDRRSGEQVVIYVVYVASLVTV